MYKLNLFKSSFELTQPHGVTAALQSTWDSAQVVAQLHREQAGRPLFLLHDGPPYANGSLHLGHFVNKSLKDTLLKFKRLQGYFAPFVPGFDCHGLPVELEVEKHGQDKRDPSAFVLACREYALSQVELQSDEFKTFGLHADWEHKYLTLDPEFEAAAARYFVELPQKVKRLRPVHWCPRCASSLAEAEVEYKPKMSESVVVLFEDACTPNRFLQVWTTTPYTLPANKAVAFNPSFAYVQVQEGERTLVRLRRDSDEADLPAVNLQGLSVRSPYTGQLVPVVAADYVTNTGTGLVHLAPSFGLDDFRVGEAYGLEVESFVDSNGRYTVGALSGMTLNEVAEQVLSTLEAQALLYSRSKMEHEYPHCWRHKTPLFFKASEEWFLDLSEVAGPAREALMDVRFVPASARERLDSMLDGRSSWCVSRNRLWGTPLVDPESRQELELLERVQTQGVAAWQEAGARRTLDVWFDSGVTHALVLKKRYGRTADVYLEGSDQHRGWFQSSLLTAVAKGEPAPFKTLVTHGFVVDENGKKYSKSSKNYQPLAKLFEQYSPDVLRLWALSQDYTKDLKLSKESLARTVERYRKLRNTVRFCLQNTVDYDFSQVPVLTHQLHMHHLQMLHQLVDDVSVAAEAYDFAGAVSTLMAFCESTSSDYFTAFKDVLYCDAAKSARRQEAQYLLGLTAQVLLRMLVPVLPYTAEEVFNVLKGPLGMQQESAALLTLQDFALPEAPTTAFEALENLKPLKREVHQYVEAQLSQPAPEGLKVKGPAQLHLTVTTPDALPAADVQDYFGCAELTLESGPAYGVQMRTTLRPLCPRCRSHRDLLFTGLCVRCDEVEQG